MRFNATVGDSRGVDVLCKVVSIVSRLCKKRCVIRLSPDDLGFVSSYNIREGLALDFRIVREQVFATYTMEGITPEHNLIFFELSTDDLTHSLSSREAQIKLKLIKKDNIPHLRIDLITNCITNEIPINFILVRNWVDFDPPNIGNPSVAVSLTSPRTLGKMLSSLKSMGAKNVTFKSNKNGEFCLNALNENSKMDVYMHDLQNLSVTDRVTESQETCPNEQFYSVLVDLKTLHSFISGLQNIASKILTKIVNGRGTILSVKEPECNLSLYLSGINQE